ncbi:MAG: MaoC family dehydratase N-terminal domain-containing protein [Rhizobiaceae bacterium]|nr:MaoC family dehydratase N-terminal domain-containing protein [Rhizobiaceae bacterium]
MLPTLAVLAQPGLWPRDLDTGIDYLHVLHGEQRLRIHHPLPVRGTVIGRTRVTNVVDKGLKRGALLLSERDLRQGQRRLAGHRRAHGLLQERWRLRRAIGPAAAAGRDARSGT